MTGNDPRIACFAVGLFAFCISTVVGDEPVRESLEIPVNHGFGRAVGFEDRVYYFGAGRSDVDVLDTKRRSWTRLSSGLTAHQLLGDRIGHWLYLLDPGRRRFVRLDLKTRRTESLPPIPTRRINGTVVAANGELYVIGGYSEDVTAENNVEIYDPKAKRWRIGPPIPGYRPKDHFHSATVLDGKLHVVGGLLDENESQPHWRLEHGRWKRFADPPLHTMWKHTVLAAAAGRIYLIAPLPASVTNKSIEVETNVFSYDPKKNRWQPVGRTPDGFPIGLFAQAVVGDRIYVLGGVRSRRVHVFDTKRAKWE